MIYNLDDKIPINKLILFALQMVLSVFVATILIANICGVAISGALVGAGLATLIYSVVTKGKSPMYISSSGAFVAPVMAALAAGGYTAVAIGGLVVSCVGFFKLQTHETGAVPVICGGYLVALLAIILNFMR